MRFLKEERGVSLVEVVASIVLITVILISFFTLFLQTKKTNVQSETIQDATYVAQIEMEEIYSVSKYVPIGNQNEIINELKNKSYTYISTRNIACRTTLAAPEEVQSELKFEKESLSYNVEVTVSKLCDYDKAGHVLIEVSNSSNTKKAFVENIYIWN